MPEVKNIGKPCAGKLHARFDEGGQVKACSLLYPFTLGDPIHVGLAGVALSALSAITRLPWLHGGYMNQKRIPRYQLSSGASICVTLLMPLSAPSLALNLALKAASQLHVSSFCVGICCSITESEMAATCVSGIDAWSAKFTPGSGRKHR